MRIKLVPKETIIVQKKKHWIIFLSAIFWFMVGIFLLTYANKWQITSVIIAKHPTYIWLAIFAFGIALLRALITYARYLSAEYIVTNKRLIMKEGLIHHHALEMSISKVGVTHIKQTLLGRIFNYGLMSFGESKEPFHDIPSPYLFRQKIREQMEE
jgi:hypothetical protein